MLAGGVSNAVLAAGDGHRQVVLKQARARLHVADEWYAPLERAMIEAAALDLVAGLTPANVPRVVDRDPGRHVIVIEQAPPGWENWKARLLQGRAERAVANSLGRILACWHSKTARPAAVPVLLGATEHFEHLRVDPFYTTVAQRAPELSGDILFLADQLRRRPACLVHGDFSPKNVLVGPDGLWVIDFEVAAVGDPAFDVAFLLCHLLLKSVHRPELAGELDACGAEFVGAYAHGLAHGIERPWPYVFAHMACLLLARVNGKSPAEYLSPSERSSVWRLGAALVRDPPETLSQVQRCRDRACW